MGSFFSTPKPERVGSKRAHDEEASRAEDVTIKRHCSGVRTKSEVEGQAVQHFDPKAKPLNRLKRRKVALWLAYSGTNYYGMQINPDVATVEGELVGALERCGLLPDTSRETLQQVQFSRAARTDKGVSAACQCVSLRIPCEVEGKVDPRIAPAINEQLPSDISVLGVVRATNGFSSRRDCFRRLYEYVIPIQVLGGGNSIERGSDGEEGDVRIARFNTILRKYIGTHCFANFTEGFKSSDDASKRYIIRVEASEPFRPAWSDRYFSVIQMYGQSFVIYQIRKMVGLALAVYCGSLPNEAIEVALSPHMKLVTPTAPALGLLLDSVEFYAYNKQRGKGLQYPIQVGGPVEVAKDRFKMDVIYREIAAKESASNCLEDWLASFASKSRYDIEAIMSHYERFCVSSVGVEEERRRGVAGQFPVTTCRDDFLGNSGGDDHAHLDMILGKYQEITGLSPRFVVRAPGRVNLIGEHCDYNDFGVIGSATRQGTFIVGSQSLDPRVSVSHVDSAGCGPGSFATSGSDVVQDTLSSGWVKYASWGWAAMIGKIISKKSSNRGSGARILVDGNLPRAAGLGSSSSLVTAAAMACARVNRTRRGREELAQIAAEGERVGAGTRGGAVDHTVSMCGVTGSAVYVSFSPKLETECVPLPTTASVVVVNSGVSAHKGQDNTTKMLFNTRVIECRIAAALVARRLKTHLSMTVSTPGQLFNMEVAGGQSGNLGELVERVGRVLEAREEMTLAEAAMELDLDTGSHEWRKRFLLGIEFDSEARLRLGARMAHVLSEAQRVESFRNLLRASLNDQNEEDPSGPNGRKRGEDELVSELGRILSASHASLRDLYECSCAEVDALVDFCLERGSLGSRITGAGWGGCILSLVPNDSLRRFVDALSARVGEASVFVLEPSHGACVLAM